MKATIIIPCRNEEAYIGACLDSIIAGDYPRELLEVLVVDGMSNDDTRTIIKKYIDSYSFIAMIDNPRRIVPTALNIGISHAHGDVIVRMDAHNTYGPDYLAKCVRYLQEYNADNVGGVWTTVPGADTIMAKSIALAITHPFGAGNAFYRIGSKTPRFVDTVPFGCFRKELFDRIGLFDEDLVRNQDDEFNARIIKNGGKILLAPDIISEYHARPTLGKLWRLYFQYGRFKPLVARKIHSVMTIRQLMPAMLVVSFIVLSLLSFLHPVFGALFVMLLVVYMMSTIAVSAALAIKNGLLHIISLPMVFWTLHFSYGLGYLKGIVDFVIFKKHTHKGMQDLPLTR
jgi:glycosyltransferase involved in cell wall biosynthesis